MNYCLVNFLLTCVCVLSSIFAADSYHCLIPTITNTTVVESECAAGLTCSCQECDAETSCQEYLYTEHISEPCCGSMSCQSSATCQTVAGTCYVGLVKWSVYVDGILKSGHVSGALEKDCQASRNCPGEWFDDFGDKISISDWIANPNVGTDCVSGKNYVGDLSKFIALMSGCACAFFSLFLLEQWCVKRCKTKIHTFSI